MTKPSKKATIWAFLAFLMLLAAGYQLLSLSSYFSLHHGVQPQLFRWFLGPGSTSPNTSNAVAFAADPTLAYKEETGLIRPPVADGTLHPTSSIIADSSARVGHNAELQGLPALRDERAKIYGKDATQDDDGRNSVVAQDDVGRCAGSPPLKVFMYDLSRRFNLGMLRRDDKDQDLPWNSSVVPPWPQRSGLRKQHSVEYWLMADLLDGRRDGERAAVRVMAPEEADVFFVPFFSSLSYNLYGNYKMRRAGKNVDDDLQVEIVSFLRKSEWWRASQGRDHVVPFHHPNAVRSFRDRFNASILVLADFGRYRKSTARLQKDVVAPYVHVVPAFENDTSEHPYESRPTLLYFQGRVRRKDDGVIRATLAKLLKDQKDVHYSEGVPSLDGLAQATAGMRSSRFCLNPAGDTPSSCRLFDAIVNHCVPVIISDKIELPFEDELNYKEFCLFFSAKEALRPGFLVDHLRRFDKQRWLHMWRRLKEVHRHFEYQFPSKNGDAVNMIWTQIHKKVPNIRLAVNRAQRLKIADWWRRKA